MGAKQVVGIDIGHSSVKVVGLTLGREPKLVGCKEVVIDSPYLQKEGFANVELIGKAIREAMQTAAPKPIPTGSLAYSAISESLVFRKVLELPALKSEKELLEAVRLEAAQYLPVSPEEMEIDYQIFNPSEDGTSQQVMVIAVNKKIVQDYLSVFASAKLPVKAIDAKPEAVGRATIKPGEKEALLLVDIGSELSTISLYESGAIRVTGSLNMGGDVIKDEETGAIDEELRTPSLKRLAEGLADEVDHVVKFYLNRTAKQQKIREVRLSGGGSMIVEIPELLSKLVDFPVTVAKPVLALPPFCDRRFMGALGCALYPLGGES